MWGSDGEGYLLQHVLLNGYTLGMASLQRKLIKIRACILITMSEKWRPSSVIVSSNILLKTSGNETGTGGNERVFSKAALSTGGLIRWNRSEFMASISEGCIVEERSFDSLEVMILSTGRMITLSAGFGLLISRLKMLSILLSQAGMPPEAFAYRKYHKPEPSTSIAGGTLSPPSKIRFVKVVFRKGSQANLRLVPYFVRNS